MLQLVNANGNHASMSCATEDVIPPVVDIKLSVALPQVPKAMRLQPQSTDLPFTYENGRVYVAVDRVDQHNVVEVVL